MDSPAAIENEVATTIQASMILECCLLAATAVVVYDQVLIIPDMFHVLKRRGFSGVSWILSLNQITLLVKTICSIPANDAILRAISNCNQAMALSFLVIGVTLTTAFNSLRLFAISLHNKSLTAATFLLGIVPAITNIYLYFMSSEPSWTFHDTVICSLYTSLSEDTLIKYVRYELLIYITDIGAVEIITRVSAVLSDILAIGGTWYYNISVYKMAYNANIKHSLAYIILRDANILAYTNSNEVTQISQTISLAIEPFVLVLPMLLTTHFMLNLQHASAATSDDTAIQDISFDQSIRRTISLRFASRISDAMGGPLEYMSVSGETLEDEHDDLSDAGEEDQPLSTGYVAVAKDDTDETEEGLLESNI
ncbi:hypothetical protein IEO21_07048 [Rhodonia placenta]|uniref:Uncharacterized protein n=1 Tax=Rhodonia placenta TaxID=104341 RepID=A0A8H7NZ31_9APHY|nr:hypothetical protein IEO21_07048 [Postia placenta]